MAAPTLRPLSLGEVLDVAFALYRSQFAPLLVVAAACQVLPMAIAVYINTTGSMAAQLGLSVLYVAVAVVLSAVVAVLEGTPTATDAMGRSWELTRGFRGKVFLAMLVAFLMLIVPGIAVGGAAAVAGFTDGAASLGILVLESVLQLFIYPYVYVVMTVLYYDLRVRKEGFDLELLASSLETA